VGLIGALAAQAHEPITTKLTWTQEISRIIYKRCASCHHQGSAAFALVSYEDARPWAKAIREEVLERRMPPWGAVKGIRAYRDDPSLTPLEVEMLVGWVEGGAPEGDAAYLPPAPVFSAAAQPRLAASDGITAPLTLPDATTVVAVTPHDLPDGASMEVTAHKPDGSVEHLIWLRNYRHGWTRTYWFRDPLLLPAGTRIVVNAPAPASAVLSIAGREGANKPGCGIRLPELLPPAEYRPTTPPTQWILTAA
jgi:hypothetical protein